MNFSFRFEFVSWKFQKLHKFLFGNLKNHWIVYAMAKGASLTGFRQRVARRSNSIITASPWS